MQSSSGTSQKAVGLLINENNGLTGIGQFTRGFSYDQFGRSAALATNLDGTLYFQRTSYDQYGRVFQSFDASTNAASPAGQLQIYAAEGFPIAVREAADGLFGQIYNEVLSLSPRMQVRKAPESAAEAPDRGSAGQPLFAEAPDSHF